MLKNGYLMEPCFLQTCGQEGCLFHFLTSSSSLCSGSNFLCMNYNEGMEILPCSFFFLVCCEQQVFWWNFVARLPACVRSFFWLLPTTALLLILFLLFVTNLWESKKRKTVNGSELASKQEDGHHAFIFKSSRWNQVEWLKTLLQEYWGYIAIRCKFNYVLHVKIT